MVGGGRGAFIGAVHRIAANIDGQIELVCGAFQQRSREVARLRLGLLSSAGTLLRHVRGDDPEGEGASGGSAHGFHLHRHAEPHALPAGKDGAGEWLPCAFATSPRRSISTEAKQLGELVKKTGPALRPHAQLHGLSAREAGARHGPRRQARQDPQSRRGVSAGLAGHAHRRVRAEAGRVAHGSEALRRRRLRRRHRHARGEPRGIHHRPEDQRTGRRPHHVRRRPPARRRRATFSCASRAAPRACCTARRSPWAKRTT